MFMTSKTGGSAGEKPVSGESLVAPFGSWKSPISAEMLVQDAVRFGDTALDGATFYWVESRPQEEGRSVIVRRRSDGHVEDILHSPYSARTTAHEYGGGTFAVADGIVWFANFQDQRVYQIEPHGAPRPITAAADCRYADFIHDASRNRLIAVREDHGRGDHEPVNEIVAVSLDDGTITVLVAGSDFFSSPRVSPDGSHLAWLNWNHPNMPWDGTELRLAEIGPTGQVDQQRLVAGGSSESIFQPEWSPDGSLYFVSDRSDWWNLYCYSPTSENISTVLPMSAEFGTPQWVFGMSTYAVVNTDRIIACYTQDGRHVLAAIDTRSGKITPYELPFVAYSGIRANGTASFMVAGAPASPSAVVSIAQGTGELTTIRRCSPLLPAVEFTSEAEAITYPSTDGTSSHAFYYAPCNHRYRGPDGDAPPLIIIIHGGPTSATDAVFDLRVQYWTSRGFAVCDVNYGGSTGYGRKYRDRLNGAWGIVDVTDAVGAARYLAERGQADPEKLVIRGGSAGGYTTLAALAFHDIFRAGASYYGVSDLALLAADTHKFESRYLDQLIGPYPAAKELYDQRSPINHLNGFTSPVIFFQGLEDAVVPPSQAERIVEALKNSGVPVAYVTFPGEQHGFRKAENIIRCHEAELYFYSRILGFELSDDVEPVDILGL